jgi:uncharacterized protein YndB with AHSA1/START domain
VTDARDGIFAALDRLHAAQEAQDIDAMLAEYDTDGFVDPSTMRGYFERLATEGAFEGRSVDLSAAEVFVHRDAALVRPVVYQTSRGPRSFSYHLRCQPDGAWRIIDNRRSYLPGESLYHETLLANAGKLVGSRGMLWVRRFDRPIEDVWHAVSTKEGLDQWWLTRDVEIDLRPGGIFKHHWTNTVVDFETSAFIDFGAPPDASGREHQLMRFALSRDGEGTVFSFFDSFAGHQLPLTVPWTAAGWHQGLNTLETALTGRAIEQHDFGLGGEFYWRYLREQHQLAARVGELAEPEIDDAAWREAYLTSPQ